MSVIRAKIKIDSVLENNLGEEKNNEQIYASAVYSPDNTTENYEFSLATPSLSLNMVISNPMAFDRLVQGKEYYLDFIPVEDSTGDK